MSNLRSTGIVRLGAVTPLQTSRVVADGAFATIASPNLVIPNGGGGDNSQRFRMLEIWAAANADNATGTLSISLSPSHQKSNRRTVERIGSLAFTAGTTTINDVDSSGLPYTFITGEFIADTMAWTEDANGVYALVRAAVNGPLPQVYSPTSNRIAKLMLPDVGNSDVIVEPWLDTGNTATSITVCYRWIV
jgi:hypothetical protein